MIDWHTHSTFSDGELPVAEVMQVAAELGLESIAVTDHWDPADESLANRGLPESVLLEHLEAIRSAAREAGVVAFAGIETCAGADGRLPVSPQALAACDLVITSPHYFPYAGAPEKGDYFDRAYWEAYKEAVLVQAAAPGDVLGHPEGYLPLKPLLEAGTTYEGRQAICRDIADLYFDDAWVDALGRRLAASGKACELHGATCTPRLRVVRRLRDLGVRFSVGSDAHARDLFGRNERALRLVRELGLTLIDPRSVRDRKE